MSETNQGLIHITHHKAGSQWIYKILHACDPNRIIHPIEGREHFLQKKVLSDKIYPTLYMSHSLFLRANAPEFIKRFVVIRDLRDTLISLYFSLKISHTLELPRIRQRRKWLENLNVEEGLIFTLENFLINPAIIQYSWYRASVPLIKYEDLLHHDEDILMPILTNTFSLSPENIQAIIKANRFEILTKRKPGDENMNSHERKGIMGDWKNYFTSSIKEKFKDIYGDLLIKMGYENNNNW